MRSDPPLRADGRCSNPGCDNLRRPERSRKYGKAAAELDPFCSTQCCKAWHTTQAALDELADVPTDTLQSRVDEILREIGR